jgi:hypothetical protein
MAFIIGTATLVSPLQGVLSVSVSQQPSIQSNYVLGSPNPYFKIITTQTQINVTNYAGSGRGYSLALPVSTSCVDASTVNFSVTPGNCIGSNPGNIAGSFFVTSYSYSKEVDGFGTQSWTLVSKPILEVQGQPASFNPPIMLRGVSTGQAVSPNITGVTFDNLTAVDGLNIQVNAGFPGIGNADESVNGEVTSIGNAVFFQLGQRGNASVSIPYTPLYTE